MPAAGTLSERKAAILHALVRQYIRTGEPVGSEALSATSGLGVSSATIRHELSALEELGYLTQPHTSAGRLPTDLAYRSFVDALPARPRLRDPERRTVIGFFEQALADVDEILRGTTVLLSRLTHYASLALAPSGTEAVIVRAELIDLGSATLLLVVFDNGRVEKRMVEMPEGADRGKILEASSAMDQLVRGRSVEVGAKAMAERARSAARLEGQILQRGAEALRSIGDAPEGEHVLLGGVSNIAADAAFDRRDSLRRVYEALEGQSSLLQFLRDAGASPPISVTIGRENPVPEMWEASVVAAPYTGWGGAVGTIGVVGPTRMDYLAAISAVRVVAERLSAAVEALKG